MNERVVWTPPQLTSAMQNRIATETSPIVFHRLLSPSERRLLTLIQSSVAPTAPATTIAESTSHAGRVKGADVPTCPRK